MSWYLHLQPASTLYSYNSNYVNSRFSCLSMKISHFCSSYTSSELLSSALIVNFRALCKRMNTISCASFMRPSTGLSFITINPIWMELKLSARNSEQRWSHCVLALSYTTYLTCPTLHLRLFCLRSAVQSSIKDSSRAAISEGAEIGDEK